MTKPLDDLIRDLAGRYDLDVEDVDLQWRLDRWNLAN